MAVQSGEELVDDHDRAVAQQVGREALLVGLLGVEQPADVGVEQALDQGAEVRGRSATASAGRPRRRRRRGAGGGRRPSG